jgi:hypothetical protein
MGNGATITPRVFEESNHPVPIAIDRDPRLKLPETSILIIAA